MSAGLSAITSKINSGREEFLSKNLMKPRQNYLKPNFFGMNQEDDRKITLEGWSQSSESFLFPNIDDHKLEAFEDTDQSVQKNHSKVFKNALTNLSEGLALMHKKSQPDAVLENTPKAQSEPKRKVSVDKQEGVEKLERLERFGNELQTQIKTNQSVHRRSFEDSEAQEKNFSNRMIVKKLDEDPQSPQSDPKDPKGFSLEIEKVPDSVNKKNGIEKVERIEKIDKLPSSYQPSIKSQRTPRGNASLNKESNNVGPLTHTKATIHVINFKTKTSSPQVAVLDKFQIFSKPNPKESKQAKIKSARGASMNLDEKDLVIKEKEISHPIHSPTSRLVPLNEFSSLRKTNHGGASFSTNLDLGIDMKIRGVGLQEPSTPSKRKIINPQEKVTLKKIFGARNGSIEEHKVEVRKARPSIYNILDAFKAQQTTKPQGSKYEGVSSQTKLGRGQSMASEVFDDLKDTKANHSRPFKKFKEVKILHKKEASGASENLEGVIQSIFDLRGRSYPALTEAEKKQAKKDSMTKNESTSIHALYRDLNLSRLPPNANFQKLVIKNGPHKKENLHLKAYTYREREL